MAGRLLDGGGYCTEAIERHITSTCVLFRTRFRVREITPNHQIAKLDIKELRAFRHDEPSSGLQPRTQDFVLDPKIPWVWRAITSSASPTTVPRPWMGIAIHRRRKTMPLCWSSCSQPRRTTTRRLSGTHGSQATSRSECCDVKRRSWQVVLDTSQ